MPFDGWADWGLRRCECKESFFPGIDWQVPMTEALYAEIWRSSSQSQFAAIYALRAELRPAHMSAILLKE
jgi:hypothetical protein